MEARSCSFQGTIPAEGFGGWRRLLPQSPGGSLSRRRTVGAVAISRQGNRLAYVLSECRINIWRVDLRGPGRTPGAPFKLIPSTRGEGHPDYSPDGKRIVFDSGRSGHPEIWVCNSDGSNSVQLTSFGGPTVTTPRWSPDGRSVVFGVEAGKRGHLCDQRQRRPSPAFDYWSIRRPMAVLVARQPIDLLCLFGSKCGRCPLLAESRFRSLGMGETCHRNRRTGSSFTT